MTKKRAFNYALESYVPVSVRTITFSPSFTNNGTRITYPVSNVASLVALFTVSPLTAGSVSVTVNVTYEQDLA